MFLTAVNPMDDNQDLEDVLYDLDTGTLKLGQRNGLQFYQTRSHAIALFKTLHAIRIEKVVFMETGVELYSKVYQFFLTRPVILLA